MKYALPEFLNLQNFGPTLQDIMHFSTRVGVKHEQGHLSLVGSVFVSCILSMYNKNKGSSNFYLLNIYLIISHYINNVN